MASFGQKSSSIVRCDSGNCCNQQDHHQCRGTGIGVRKSEVLDNWFRTTGPPSRPPASRPSAAFSAASSAASLSPSRQPPSSTGHPVASMPSFVTGSSPVRCDASRALSRTCASLPVALLARRTRSWKEKPMPASVLVRTLTPDCLLLQLSPEHNVLTCHSRCTPAV